MRIFKEHKNESACTGGQSPVTKVCDKKNDANHWAEPLVDGKECSQDVNGTSSTFPLAISDDSYSGSASTTDATVIRQGMTNAIGCKSRLVEMTNPLSFIIL